MGIEDTDLSQVRELLRTYEVLQRRPAVGIQRVIDHSDAAEVANAYLFPVFLM
ncbi:hypothetical protein [Mycobacteroides chelonae]|uniref:hypothetical protein n=1 Tax=Mycobacteroides chelonae TaxID=1774 RepID=UPI0012FFA016|nr:hypothetical protein [Mycobacteroides chelonae]